MLAKVASHYGWDPVVAIDPYNSPILLDHQSDPEASSYRDFVDAIMPPEYQSTWNPTLRTRPTWPARGTDPSDSCGSTAIIAMKAPRKI